MNLLNNMMIKANQDTKNIRDYVPIRKTIVLGLIGLKGSGKDYCSDEIMDLVITGEKMINDTRHIKFNKHKLKISGGIKKIIHDYLYIPEPALESQECKANPVTNSNPALKPADPDTTLRDVMIGVGQTLKKYDDLVWIRKVTQDIKDLHNKLCDTSADSTTDMYNMIAITDVRFPVEIEELKKLKEYGDVDVQIADVSNCYLYEIEKNIVRMFGVNPFSRWLVKLINPGLAKESEWSYFTIKKERDWLYPNNIILQTNKKK